MFYSWGQGENDDFPFRTTYTYTTLSNPSWSWFHWMRLYRISKIKGSICTSCRPVHTSWSPHKERVSFACCSWGFVVSKQAIDDDDDEDDADWDNPCVHFIPAGLELFVKLWRPQRSHILSDSGFCLCYTDNRIDPKKEWWCCRSGQNSSGVSGFSTKTLSEKLSETTN